MSNELIKPNWAMESLQSLLQSIGLDGRPLNLATTLLALILIVILAIISNYVAKGILLRLLQRLVKKTKTKWDDKFIKWKVFHRLSHLAPAYVIYSLTPYALVGYPRGIAFCENLSFIYMILVAVLVLDSALNAGLDIYRDFEVSREVPIKGFVQVIKIVLYFVAFILVISVAMNKSPGLLLSGLGALTAILMLIFKDPILGFVAGLQLTGNKMVAVGDWIEMPKHGADGDVLEVALTTVKVQNWDKTITTIPTYALISESFKNWRGMSESGGRRIKRCVFIDMQTIRFCDEDTLKRFSKIAHISEYIEKKKKELDEHNQSQKADLASLANGRRLTNIGTFRAYVVAYLKNHSMINQDMTFLVRQLAPTDHGVPLEIYVFCKDKVWANYEAIQGDIFDHILAVVGEFDLKVFQHPAGADFQKLLS